MDKEAAPVVRYIFDRRLEKAGYNEIARELENKGIPCPYVYLASKGFSCRTSEKVEKRWTRYAIYNILMNPGLYRSHGEP